MTHHRLASRKSALRLAAVGAAAALTAALLPGQAASAAPSAACDNRANNTYQKLLDCVTLRASGSTRRPSRRSPTTAPTRSTPAREQRAPTATRTASSTSPACCEDAGYEVTLDPVEITFNFPAVLRQLTPVEADYETGVFTGSGSGDVEGNVNPIDINLDKGPTAVSTSGCEAADFAGFDWSGDERHRARPARHVLLRHEGVLRRAGRRRSGDHLQPGQHAEREALIVADATSVDPPIPGPRDRSRTASPWSARASPTASPCPQPGSTAFVKVLPAETRTDYNVIAELPGKNEDNVVMAGAHLDSVIEGPGINDNGSGSAALLETALMMANLNPQNTLRFAWWAGEEQGLVGSADYVDGLSQAERDRIALYMNYDMVGSPNYIFMVYDADESTFEAPVCRPGGVDGDRGPLRVVLHRDR